MVNKVDEREGAGLFLNVPQKLDNPFPDLKYFRENKPVFYYPPLDQWFVFGHDDVASLFSDPRLSADRMTPRVVRWADTQAREDLLPAHGGFPKPANFAERFFYAVR